MEAIRYLFKTEAKNFPRKLMAKKGSIGMMIFLLCYMCLIPFIFNYADLEFLKGTSNFAYMLCIGALMETPFIMQQFLERKGIVFSSADIHMMFQTPVNPKVFLIYGKNKHIFVNVITQFYLAMIGYAVFDVSLLPCLAYVIASLLIGIIRDTAMAVLMYGYDKKNKKAHICMRGFLYAIIACIGVSLIYTLATNTFGANLIPAYFDNPMVMAIPVVGWEISLIRLCLLGPSTLTIITTICNMVFIAVLVILAWKMPCNGEYFEDAMMYTEQFEYAIQKRKMGGVYLVGQKNHAKKAVVKYKKDGGKAYFYKNLLEYKKMPLFIFSAITGILAFIAIALCFSNFTGDSVFTFPFCMMLVLVFTCIIFQGFGIRWKKEILSPYFRVIPAKTGEKLFHIVIWEYTKALLEGSVFVIILCLGYGTRYIPYAVFTAVMYCCIRSSRMHLSIICNALLSKVFGRSGIMLVEYASILFVIIPVLGILLAASLFGMELIGFVIGTIVSILFLIILFVLSCKAADKMNY